MQSYIGFIAFIILYALFNRLNPSPAFHFIKNIPYASFTQELSNKLSVGARQSPKNKPPPLDIPVGYLSAQNVKLMPFYQSLTSLWSFFLAGSFSLLICILFGALNLESSANLFCPLGIAVIFLVMRFGGMTSSNSEKNRKFSFYYALILSTIFYIVISRWSLYAVDPRPIALAQFKVSKFFVDIIFALFVFFILYSMCFPMLKYMHVVHSIKTLSYAVFKWEICQKAFKEVVGLKRNLIVYLYNLMPFVTVVFVFMRKFLLKFIQNDLYLDIAYIAAELVIAVIYMWLIRIQLRIILTDPYKYLTEFDKNRSHENSKAFQSALNRSLVMIPTYVISLSVYPMLIILCSILYFISYFMTGLSMEISRIVPLFILAAMDCVMGTNKVVSFLIPENN